MEKISIKLVSTLSDNNKFWDYKNEYFLKDIMPNEDLGTPISEEDQIHFMSNEYYSMIENLCMRSVDKGKKIFFEKQGQIIGFCLYCTYLSEDKKCFIIDFCILPEFREKGYGHECFECLKQHELENGAEFFELNTSCKRSMNFWETLGFVYNGYDSHAALLMLLPPEETKVKCEELEQGDMWQILDLENGYKYDINEPFLTEKQQDSLTEAICTDDIRFFVIKRANRIIGMCSLSTIFSTFECGSCGIFEDFYIEPAFRKKGFARLLTKYVQDKCKEMGINSIWVGSADCDDDMYKSLGFDINIGNLLTWSNN